MLRITQSAENSSFSSKAETAKGGIGGDDCEDATIKRSPFKNSNRAGYLFPNAKKVFNYLRHAFTKALIL